MRGKMVELTKGFKNKLWFVCLILCIQLSLYSQNIRKQDSLLIETLYQTVKDTTESNPGKAFYYINEILKLSSKNKYDIGFIKGYNALAATYKRKTDYKKALYFYQKAIDLSTQGNYQRELSMSLYNIADLYEELANYDKAFEASTTALSINKKLHDSIRIARCYRLIAQCESDKGDNHLSIFYFEKAIPIFRKLKSLKSLSATLSNIALVYVAEKRYKDAITALREAEVIDVNMGNLNSLSVGYLNTGFCYDDMGVTDSAEYFYLRSLELSKKFDMKDNQVILLNNLGELNLTKTKNYSMAENYLLQGLVMAKEINSIIDIRNIQANLAVLYSLKGDYKTAYFYKDQFEISSDSMMNEQKMKTIEELSIKFETKEIEERNKILQQENDLQRIKSQQKNYLIYAVLLFTVLVIIIFILYNRQNKFKLQKQSLDIEQKLLQIQMNPHFIFNSLQAIQSFILTNQQQQSSSYLTSFSRLMRLILENSKHELISLDKEITTLTYYLELQQLRFKEVFVYSINIDSSLDREFTMVPPMLLQPFIENAIEHGFKKMKEKGELAFNVLKTDRDLILEVIDNGLGIDKSINTKHAQKDHHSYALEIIKKRIELLNLKLKSNIKLTILDVSSIDESKHGTKISIQFPLIHKSFE